MTDLTGIPPGLNPSGPARGHSGDMRLRRYLAEELAGEEKDAVARHATGCAECARRLEVLRAEQRAFEGQISFDRFSAGVERAVRVPRAGARQAAPRWWKRPTSALSFGGMFGLGAVAFTVALIVTAQPLFEQIRVRNAADAALHRNNVKGGGPQLAIRIAAPDDGPQRTAAETTIEPLARGERLRIGVKPGGRRYLFCVSLDDKGVVTALYPETGISVAVPPTIDLQYLPDSVELTGSGIERVIVVLSDEPLERDIMQRAALAALAKAKGDVAHMPPLVIEGDQFHRLFQKP